jgi:hypothetical protein
MFRTNVSCTLTSDNADSPYYVLEEQVRSDVSEGQVGILMHLQLQFVDVTTFKSLQLLIVDIWSCNVTRIYSGGSPAGEGGLGDTFLRVFSKPMPVVLSTLIQFSLVTIKEKQPTSMFLPTLAPQSTRTVHSAADISHTSRNCSSILHSSTLLKLQLRTIRTGSHIPQMTSTGSLDTLLAQHMIPSSITSGSDLVFHRDYLSGTLSGSSHQMTGPHME